MNADLTLNLNPSWQENLTQPPSSWSLCANLWDDWLGCCPGHLEWLGEKMVVLHFLLCAPEWTRVSPKEAAPLKNHEYLCSCSFLKKDRTEELIAVLGLPASFSIDIFFLPLFLPCARSGHPLAVELVEQLLLPSSCVTLEQRGWGMFRAGWDARGSSFTSLKLKNVEERWQNYWILLSTLQQLRVCRGPWTDCSWTMLLFGKLPLSLYFFKLFFSLQCHFAPDFWIIIAE